MLKKDIKKIFVKLKLGEISNSPEQVFGGLLHKMYRIETNAGTYAVKALNPKIMARKTAYKNLVLSEKAAKIAYDNNIPMVHTYEAEDETLMHLIDGRYYMVFDWTDAKSIQQHEVSPHHCTQVGRILAQMHNIDLSKIVKDENSMPIFPETDWEMYCSSKEAWTNELSQIKHKLYEWQRLAAMAETKICLHKAINHNDMDCKNVLWDKISLPIVIDWECAGYTNPLSALITVLSDWTGFGTENYNSCNFKALIESYLNCGGSITGELTAVLNYGYKGTLDWLEYSIKRSLGIESNDEKEQELGTQQVFSTLKALKNYEKSIPIMYNIIDQYIDD